MVGRISDLALLGAAALVVTACGDALDGEATTTTTTTTTPPTTTTVPPEELSGSCFIPAR